MEETTTAYPNIDDSKQSRTKRTSSADPTSKPEQFWRTHTSVARRNDERAQLELLLKKTAGTKNPRFLKSSESAKPKSLVKTYAPGERPTDASQLPPIFIATPSVVSFTSYEPGKVYEATLELRNVSAVLQNCKMIPPKSGVFGINFGEFPSENSFIAPGMACLYKIRFLPDALCEFEDSVVVQIPDRPSLTIPLIGKRPHPILSIPSSISVGECLVAATKVTSVPLKNTGGEGRFCVIPKNSWPCTSWKQALGSSSQQSINIGDGFVAVPGTFRLKTNEEMLLQFAFNPLEIREYSTEFVLVCDNCHVQRFSIRGNGVKLNFNLSYIDGGFYTPTPQEFIDAFASHHVAFPTLNLGMAFDKRLRVKNTRQIDIPFVWAVVKPHMVAPVPPLSIESEDSNVEDAKSTNAGTLPPDCRIIEEQSAFSVEPQAGVFQAGKDIEFTLSFLPDQNIEFHSTLHLIVPGVPQLTASKESERNDGEGAAATSAQSTKSNQSANVADVTAVEIDCRGKCDPYQLTLNPCAIYIDGPTMVRTSTRHTFTLSNHSHGPAAFEWQSLADEEAIIEVEPKIGVLEPSCSIDLTLIVTGTKPGRVVKQVPCWIEFCPEAVCLRLEAHFKGPQCMLKSCEGNNPLVNIDFGLIRKSSSQRIDFNVCNVSAIECTWNLQFVNRLPDEAEPTDDDENDGISKKLIKEEQLTFSKVTGTLAPLANEKVSIKMTPEVEGMEVAEGMKTGFLRLNVEHGSSNIVQMFAHVQNPTVCLQQSEVRFPGQIFVDTLASDVAVLVNKTNLSTEFQWDTESIMFGEKSQCKKCDVMVDPSWGAIGPRERVPLNVQLMANESGYLEVYLTCVMPETGEKLVLLVTANVVGLDVSYSVFEELPPSRTSSRLRSAGSSASTRPPSGVEKCVVGFGDFKIGKITRRQLVLKNKTLIPANFKLEVSKFAPTAEVCRELKEAEIRRKLMSSDVKTVNQVQSKLLQNGLGLAVVTIPSQGHLPAEGTIVIEVFAMADMWGEYHDEIISQVGDLEPHHIGVDALVHGSPLLFQMMVAQRDKTAMCRFGVAVQGTAPVTKKLRLLNEGPCDIRMDWRLFEIKHNPKQFVDFLHYILEPFPPDMVPRDNEKSLTSADKLVSCVVRKHDGTEVEPANAIFDINPRQFIIKGRSHTTVEVTLDPRNVPTLAPGEEKLNIEAYGTAYVSLSDKVREHEDGSVKRAQWFDAMSVRVNLTAQIQPAILAMEEMDDDSYGIQIAAANILPKTMYSDVEPKPPIAKKHEPVALRFYNYHETELVLQAEILAPFKIVYIGTATKNGLIDKPVSKTGQISLPAHDTLLVKVNVDTSLSMLSDLETMVPNLATNNGRFLTLASNTGNRCVHYRRFLSINFSNGTNQSVRLSCAVPLPLMTVNVKELKFETTFIGNSRELPFDVVNLSQSDTWFRCHIETESDEDRACFKLRQNGGRVGPTAKRRLSISVVFNAKHRGQHSARVIVSEIMLGQQFVIELSGEGSYDEKYSL